MDGVWIAPLYYCQLDLPIDFLSLDFQPDDTLSSLICKAVLSKLPQLFSPRIRYQALSLPLCDLLSPVYGMTQEEIENVPLAEVAEEKGWETLEDLPYFSRQLACKNQEGMLQVGIDTWSKTARRAKADRYCILDLSLSWWDALYCDQWTAAQKIADDMNDLASTTYGAGWNAFHIPGAEWKAEMGDGKGGILISSSLPAGFDSSHLKLALPFRFSLPFASGTLSLADMG